jgi:hypothetical protein
MFRNLPNMQIRGFANCPERRITVRYLRIALNSYALTNQAYFSHSAWSKKARSGHYLKSAKNTPTHKQEAVFILRSGMRLYLFVRTINSNKRLGGLI